MTTWVISPNLSFPASFDTEQEAREWADENYGQIVDESQIDPEYLAYDLERKVIS